MARSVAVTVCCAPLAPVPVGGEGAALIEVPRGVLQQSESFDSRGICSGSTIITSTAINKTAMELSLDALVAVMVGDNYDQVRHACERLVSCFAPPHLLCGSLKIGQLLDDRLFQWRIADFS